MTRYWFLLMLPENKSYSRAISNRLQKMKGELEITTLTLEGQTVFSKKVSFDLGANGCEDVASITTTELYGGRERERSFHLCDVE